MHTLHASLIPSPSRRHPPSKESIKKKKKTKISRARNKTWHAHPKCHRRRPLHRNPATQDHLHNLRKERKKIHTRREEVWAGGEEDRKLPPEIPTPLSQSTTSSTSRALTLKNQGKRTGRWCWGGREPLFTRPTPCEASGSSFQDTGDPRQRERTGGRDPKARK